MNMRIVNRLLTVLCLIAGGIVLWILYLYNYIPHRQYGDEDFQIIFQAAQNDQNQNGIDDFYDILAGAKQEVLRHPQYRSEYYEGGYPPDEEGVCTDVIWRSLQNAGYDLKALMDADIAACVECYPRTDGHPDPNIDFRRVPNIHVFLARHTRSCTTDITAVDEWQAGDIVVFSDSHIAIVSDIRNHHGIPFLIHNAGLYRMEEDCLWREAFLKGVSGHYRFIYHENAEF